ncbi:SufS family cysteine desulfurase [Aestuariibacter sp. AA17]|uniref:cysteine desulfurase n=1 Tax=Fluctibacter corallii TaxID=2984329 RepID=A0ABT3A9A2_9ALTE|nr:SufS family cysteine desulfurase [Aestuariibacter sp. AA17]MCV2885208.1 SufS family cysteine desulfurase [Aestuariibacter sp. AA17]
MNTLRQHFPIFQHMDENVHGYQWVYLDSSATTQKPQNVIQAVNQFYLSGNANVHRASHDVARKSTEAYEQARKRVAAFLRASSHEEIVWTKGATEGMNLIASSITSDMLNGGKRILISATEHHANIVPWQRLAERFGMSIDVIPVDEKGVWKLNDGLSLLGENTAIVALGHVSNALGNINPISPFIDKAKEVGALTIIDGCQAVAHFPVDVTALDCDFYLFSGHKVFAPMGVGVLYGKADVLNALQPYQVGGEMILDVEYTHSSYRDAPYKFETGTPNVPAILGLAEAIQFVQTHFDEIQRVESELYEYLLESISAIKGLELWGDNTRSVGVVSFTSSTINNQDLGILLNEQNIALRVGHHCAMPLMKTLGISGTLRISLSCYNTKDDIDRVIAAISRALSHENDTMTMSVESGSSISTESETTDTSSFPLAKKVSTASSWDEKYRQIMLAGKQLERLGEDEKSSDNEVHGCESRVWVEVHTDPVVVIKADSASKIIRGLLAVLLEPLQHQPKSMVMQFNPQDYLSSLGLEKHISESRGNGLKLVISAIKEKLEE